MTPRCHRKIPWRDDALVIVSIGLACALLFFLSSFVGGV